MAETNDIFEEKGKHLVGKIITSNVTGGRIANIDLPISEDFANILVIDANDLKTEGYINVLDNRVPVFAQDHVSFKGQPILAVFAHDMESVELYAKEIKISYQISPEKESSQVTTIGKPFVWSYGRPEEYFNGTNSKIGSSFYVKSYPATILGDQDFFAFTGSDGKVYLKVPTQWPINLKENVARVIGKSKSQVIVNTDSVYAPNDQFVIEPTILASIAATAAMKSGEPVILKTPISTWQPKTEFLFETSVGKDGSTPATRVHCTVDLGAFPIFREEVCYNILAGVVPPYPVKAMEVSIVVQSSNTVPANFFGDLGYAMALAAAENHENIVAETLGVSQSKWRLTRLEGEEGFPLCSSVKSFKDFKRFRKTIESVANSSNFDRKSSVFLQKEMKKLNFNPLINYCKGIGIGCSQGVAGFSNHFSSRLGYEVSITYTEDKKVLVSIGMVINRTAANIWKKVIKSVLDVEEENILFKNINAEGVDDFGPNTMSRKLGIVPQLLLQACEDIKRKMEFSRLPLTVTTQSEVLLSDPFYTSTFFGSMVIEIHLDTISLLPVIDRVWASLSFGRILSKDLLEDTIRRSISATISELCPVSSGDFELKLELLENPELPITSGTSAIKAITASALTNAISQAVGHRIKEIPITEEDFFNMTRKKYAGGSK